MKRCLALLNARPPVIPKKELAGKLKIDGLSEWKVKNDTITRTYTFNNFRQAWVFMASNIEFINLTDHHPNWSNVYNKVVVQLSTHDTANKKPGITKLDLDLARHMDTKASHVSNKKR